MNSNESLSTTEDFYIDKEPCVFVSHKYARFLNRQQRDGIRFLYAQWKKKRHGGVILNDPVNHISAVQAFLFMNAVRTGKPNLVLCNKAGLGNFNTLFKFWTDNYLFYTYKSQDKISFNTPCLMLIDTPEKWCRRKWGILILCCQDPSIYTLLYGVDAEFKIIITDHNVKTHFSEYTKLYKWLNPNDKIFSEVYKTANKNFRQRMIFESMLEDTVLRRDYEHILKPYTPDFTENLQHVKKETYFAYFDPTYPNISKAAKLPKKRAKNKDKTGLKVKSSIKSSKQIEPIIQQQKFEDVELFIKNNAPIHIDDIESSNLEKYSDTEIKDIEMAANLEVVPHNMTPEAVARDESITAENIDDVVMASTKNDCENSVSHEDHKNIHVNDTIADEVIVNELNQDKFKAFDASLNELEKIANKKYKGSILDSIF